MIKKLLYIMYPGISSKMKSLQIMGENYLGVGNATKLIVPRLLKSFLQKQNVKFMCFLGNRVWNSAKVLGWIGVWMFCLVIWIKWQPSWIQLTNTSKLKETSFVVMHFSCSVFLHHNSSRKVKNIMLPSKQLGVKLAGKWSLIIRKSKFPMHL